MLKSWIYEFVICRGGTDMCFLLGFGRKRPKLKQYRISGLTKPKAIVNDIKRTLRKVNNPCNRGYKHRCFPPCGKNTSPRLMFLSLKLVIRGMNPQSSIIFHLGVTTYYLAKAINNNEEHARITQEQKYKR